MLSLSKKHLKSVHLDKEVSSTNFNSEKLTRDVFLISDFTIIIYAYRSGSQISTNTFSTRKFHVFLLLFFTEIVEAQ